MRLVSLLTLAVLMIGPVAAQITDVEGTVWTAPRDDGPAAPVPNASVFLWTDGGDVVGATYTDSLGRFSLGRVPPGAYTVEARHLRHGEHEGPLTVPANAVARVALRLPEARFRCLREDGEEETRWRSIFFRDLDAIVRAYGLPPLREVAPAPARRELRLWIVPPFGGTTLTRLVEADGTLEGEVVVSDTWDERWPVDTLETRARAEFHDWLAASCGRPLRTGAGAVACRARFTETPDWRGLLHRVEAAGVWTLPDDSTLPGESCVVGTDGTTLIVETLEDADYRTYRYWEASRENPWWPEELQAADVQAAVGAVLRRVVRAPY